MNACYNTPRIEWVGFITISCDLPSTLLLHTTVWVFFDPTLSLQNRVANAHIEGEERVDLHMR